MRSFDYSFLKNELVPISFINMTNTIYMIKENSGVRKLDYPDIFSSLKKIAVVQSVKSSNAIEGIVTTDKRIEEIVNNSSAPLNHSEQEIIGYKDALSFIHDNYSEISINEETILELHRILLSNTEEYGGQYKTENNIIREIRQDGTSLIRWSPVPFNETKEAMCELVNAYTEARDDALINKLLLIPCFILDFLCIHPFKDGNGRMSRLLTLLLLYKSGFDIPMYISFEEQINNMKGAYYDALKDSSIGWHENANTYIPFINNFITTLYMCYKELDKRFLIMGNKKVSKKERIKRTVINAIIPISKQEILGLLPDVSITTVELVLSEMLKNDEIEKIGSNRLARYRRKK